MPTYSKKCDGKGDCCDDGKKNCKTTPVLLSCGQGMSAVFPGNNESEPIIPSPSTARLGLITINTAGICKPVVEIEFSSIVSLINPNNNFGKAVLNFQLFRSCTDEDPILVNSWLYEVFKIEDDNNVIRLSSSFSFAFCECLDCPECCDYFVEVSVGGLQFIESITIDKVYIAALTGESGDCDKDEICTKSMPRSLADNSALLSCGEGINGSFVNDSVPTITVGQVFVDTMYISKPIVSIEFSSIVNYLQTDAGGATPINQSLGSEGSLKFELFRVCDNRKPVLLNEWK